MDQIPTRSHPHTSASSKHRQVPDDLCPSGRSLWLEPCFSIHPHPPIPLCGWTVGESSTSPAEGSAQVPAPACPCGLAAPLCPLPWALLLMLSFRWAPAHTAYFLVFLLPNRKQSPCYSGLFSWHCSPLEMTLFCFLVCLLPPLLCGKRGFRVLSGSWSHTHPLLSCPWPVFLWH